MCGPAMMGLQVFALALISGAYPVPSQHGFVEFDLHKSERRWTDSLKAVDSSQDRVISTNLVNKKFYYQIQLGVGNPPQLLDFTIDTGSSDLWVMASTNPWCTTDPLNETGIDCTGSVFNPNKSRTFQNLQEDFSIEYGDGTFANGTLVKDTLRIGESSILNSTFAMADVGNSSTCVFGVGFTGNEANSHIHKNGTGVYPTYFNVPTMMKKQGLITTNAFSLWLNAKDADQGTILFGGIDRAKYEGDLVVMPVYNNYHNYTEHPTQTRVMLNGIKFDGQPIADFNIAVLLDSGTSYAYLPEPLVHAVGNSIGFNYDPGLGYYFGGIDTAKGNVRNVQLNFSGVDLDLPVEDLLVELTLDDETTPLIINDQPQAILALSAADDDYLYILGDVFLRSMYAVFDLDHYEIALAKAKVNVTQRDVVTIGASIPGATQAPLYASTFPNNSSYSTYQFSPATPAPSTLSLDLTPNTLTLASESIPIATPTGALSLGNPSAPGSIPTRPPVLSTATADRSDYWAPLSRSTSTISSKFRATRSARPTAPADIQYDCPGWPYFHDTDRFFTLPSTPWFTDYAPTSTPCSCEEPISFSAERPWRVTSTAIRPCTTDWLPATSEECYATVDLTPGYSDEAIPPCEWWREDPQRTTSPPCGKPPSVWMPSLPPFDCYPSPTPEPSFHPSGNCPPSLHPPEVSILPCLAPPETLPVLPRFRPTKTCPPSLTPPEISFSPCPPPPETSLRVPPFRPTDNCPPSLIPPEISFSPCQSPPDTSPGLPAPAHQPPPLFSYPDGHMPSYFPPKHRHPRQRPHDAPYSEESYDQYIQLPDGELVPKRRKQAQHGHDLAHNGWFSESHQAAPAQYSNGCPSCGNQAGWSAEREYCDHCDFDSGCGGVDNTPCGFFRKFLGPIFSR